METKIVRPQDSPKALHHRIVGEISDVPDHARDAQASARNSRVRVEIAAVKIGVADDRLPGHFVESEAAYLAAVRDEFCSPIRPAAVDELQWFFQQKAVAAEGGRIPDLERFYTAQRAFDGPRFNALYRRWRELGPRALAALSSPVLADALRRGTGEVETHVLVHLYSQLQTMVGTA